jgi:hypothetical protein
MIDIHPFVEWNRQWERVWSYSGSTMADCDSRISKIIQLWTCPVPGKWRRNTDLPRLLSSNRYTRRDKENPQNGEHRIEQEILCEHFQDVVVLGESLVDGFNALPLTIAPKGSARLGNVEVDLFLLIGDENRYVRVAGEVKSNRAHAWWATVENLRQLRLLREADFVASIFDRRNPLKGSVSSRAPIVGMVIAPREFYSANGQKANSVQYAHSLIQAMRGHCQLHLTVWDRQQRRITELS